MCSVVAVAVASHHLIFHRRLLAIHHVPTLVDVLDVREPERTVAVGVALEFGDGGSSVLLIGELDYTGAARASIWLVLNLGALDLADGGEELNHVLVAGAPRQLSLVSSSQVI